MVNLYMYKQRRLAEIQTQTYCKLIDGSMTAQPSLLSPISILPPSETHCSFMSARKNTEFFSNNVISSNFLLSGKCLSWRVFVFYTFTVAVFLRSDVIAQVCPNVYFNTL